MHQRGDNTDRGDFWSFDTSKGKRSPFCLRSNDSNIPYINIQRSEFSLFRQLAWLTERASVEAAADHLLLQICDIQPATSPNLTQLIINGMWILCAGGVGCARPCDLKCVP
jgi:hypothetical protein